MDVTGSAGEYELAIQATIGGKGTQCHVFISGITWPKAGIQTDANGFLCRKISFSERSVEITVRLMGTTENTEKAIRLSGPRVPPIIPGGFWTNVRAAINHSRSGR